MKRTFNLTLHETKQTNFANKLIEIDKLKINLDDQVRFYEGFLNDEPNGESEVTGAFVNSLFLGSIRSKKHGRFFIEPIRRFEPIDESAMIIYHEDDLDLADFEPKSNANDSIGCGKSFDNVNAWLENQHKINFDDVGILFFLKSLLNCLIKY